MTSILSANPSFRPLSIEDMGLLSREAMRAVARDLLIAGDLDQFFALRSLNPLEMPGSTPSSSTFDTEMAGLFFLTVDAARVGDAFDMIRASREACSGGGASYSRQPSYSYFGALLIHCSLRSLASSHAGDDREASLWLDKAERIAASSIPLGDPLRPEASSFPTFFCIPMDDPRAGLPAYEPLAQAARAAAMRKDERSTHCLAPALLLAASGEPRVLQALCSRPERVAESDFFFGPKPDALTQFYGERLISILERPKFWIEQPDAAAAFFKAATQAATVQPISRIPFLAHMLSSCEGDSSAPAFQAASSLLGDKIFSFCNIDSNDLRFTVSQVVSFMEKSGPAMLPAAKLQFERIFSGPSSSMFRDASGDYKGFLWPNLEPALFSPVPGVAEAIWSSLALHAPGVDPYQQLFARSPSAHGYSALLRSASKSGRPEILAKALEGAGADPCASFQGSREGLSISASMFIATEATNVEVFAAALSWLDSKGLLDDEADRRAWVCSTHNTRKKGDLLSMCVALGKPDFAQAFLKLRPQWDLKPARAVAKAMTHHSFKDRGAIAMSAWESVLLNQALGPAAPDAATPAPRRARSL